MRIIIHSVKFLIIVFGVLIVTVQSCQQSGQKEEITDSLSLRKSIPESPALSPEESIKKMHLEKGFVIKLVAAEPLVTAPVAMSFDERGRMWVVEMEDYMPDTLGTGEDQPTGKIVILSDTNGDGIMDERKVFLDSLVLPRAICLIEDGILVAESPRLFYYKIKNDLPVKKTLVDAAYAEGGNVEHQPNGLLRALDNWIYNAKSSKRYRKKGDHWLIEKTHFRGQWGITQDDQGRLFYNNNSENLLGDFFSAGLGATNKNQKRVSGFNEKIVADTRVYPVRPNTGVNRGYMEGVLDDSLRLINFTAACGPVIYRGNLFDKEYYGNAFVAEPAANLIKRDILQTNGYQTGGKAAYVRKEFLASEDERFRPVNLYNGPDGALYIVDMYRGIIQHKTYLTPYLKVEIEKRELSKPLTCGRIYKVVPKDKKEVPVHFTNDNLIELLQHPDGWVRNKAQQLLVDKKDKLIAPQLRELLQNTTNPLALIHSLWTMEGLGVLQQDDVLPLLTQNDWTIRMQALSVLPSVINKANYQKFLPVLQEMIHSSDTLATPYIAFLAHSFQPLNPMAARQLLLALIKKYPDNIYVADAVISNFENKENTWYKELMGFNPDTNLVINKRLKKVMEDIVNTKNRSDAQGIAKEFPKGVKLFQSVCQTCHGLDGNGIKSLAPPLNNSNWVVGDKNKLISIVLYGLSGPVTVDGKVYQAPEINGEMPGIGSNKEISDDDVAQVLNFIRNSWGNKAPKITIKDVTYIRNKFKGRQKSFTIDELSKLR